MFERHDWTLFRNLGTLSQKAGVPLRKLRQLVVKELVDNALDAGAKVEFGKDGSSTYWVQDDGPGVPGDPSSIARLFSVNRPLTSTKVVRLPARGALGNGLRVVVGAALASGGHLEVWTQGHHYKLKPKDDGSTEITSDELVGTEGTRIAVTLGEGIPQDEGDLRLGKLANGFNFAKTYQGKTSAWWYDSDSFFELLLSAGSRPVVDLLAQFDEGLKFELTADWPTYCDGYTRDSSESLLRKLRSLAPEIKSSKIGQVGNPYKEPYAKDEGVLVIAPGRGSLKAHLPFVVECFAMELSDQDSDDVLVCYVNGTPIVGETSIRREKGSKIAVFGCGLKHYVEKVSTKRFAVRLNVTTPYMPITTDGKEPDFSRYLESIEKVMSKATRKLRSQIRKREQPSSQKDLILGNIEEAIRQASGEGKYRFSLRQLYYASRPFCLEAGHAELSYANFCTTITNYEATYGEIPLMYRDPRGTLYHPHERRSIPIGTIAVEEYARPDWTFNKILYCEKEGFTHLLQADGWPERNDCALLSSKGFASRAVRDVLDLLGDTDEELLFFCIHDADASGGLIYQALQDATTARAARRVKIVNLGLDPWEAVSMSLQIEEFKVKGNKRLPTARYVKDYNDEAPPRSSGEYRWDGWLQGRRVELNAMTSPQFISWLDSKMEPYNKGKVVPPAHVLERQAEEAAEAAVRQQLAKRILREAGIDALVKDRMQGVKDRLAGVDFVGEVRAKLEVSPGARWIAPLKEIAEEATT